MAVQSVRSRPQVKTAVRSCACVLVLSALPSVLRTGDPAILGELEKCIPREYKADGAQDQPQGRGGLSANLGYVGRPSGEGAEVSRKGTFCLSPSCLLAFSAQGPA